MHSNIPMRETAFCMSCDEKGTRLAILDGMKENGPPNQLHSQPSTVRIFDVFRWSDKTHHLFPDDTRKIVLHLMCIRERLNMMHATSAQTEAAVLPKLPLGVWLAIFEKVVCLM
jgi:hypothetical protein